MNDFDDDYPQQVDPFQPRWHERILGPLVWLLDAIRFWLSWPFQGLVHAVSALSTRVIWWLGWVGFRLRLAWRWLWFRTAEFLQLEGMRQQIRGLQDETSKAMGSLGDSVRAQTTRAPWLLRMRESLGLRLQSIHLGSLWLTEQLAEWAERSPLVHALLLPFRGLVQLTAQLGDFLWSWIWTRQYRHLWLAAPAVVLLMPLAYCAIRLPFHSQQAKTRHYRGAAIEALRLEDYEGAQLFYRKLQQLGNQSEKVVFESAMLAAQQGDTDDAYQQLQAIAPLQEMGLPDAHFWIAQAIAEGFVEKDNPDRLQLLQTHLNHVVSFYPEQPDATLLLAELHQSAGRGDQAVELLDELSPDRLSTQQVAELANRYAELGRPARATQRAREAIVRFELLATAGPTKPSVHDYLNWAAATELTGDLPQALEILFDGHASYPDDSLVKDVLIATCTRDDKQQFARMVPARQLDILERLLDLEPNSDPVLQKLALLTVDSPVAEQALQLLEHQRPTGDLSVRACEAVAEGCLLRSDWERAISYYEVALRQDDQQHIVRNNLAWLLAVQRPLDVPRALELANQAVALQPGDPHYRETRGQILLRLQRWEEAVRDLELALNGMPTTQQIHEALAIAYEEMGQLELARIHRQRAGGA